MINPFRALRARRHAHTIRGKSTLGLGVLRARANILRAHATPAHVIAFITIILLCLSSALFLAQRQADADSHSVNLTMGKDIFYGKWSTNPFWADGVIAYCAQPEKQSPSNGRYSTTALYTLKNASGSQHTKEELAKVLYYGYGGPGFDRALFPSSWYDGSAMTDDYYIALTHIIVSDVFTCSNSQALANTGSAFSAWANKYVMVWNADTQSTNNNSTEAKILAKDLPAGFANSCFVISPTNSVDQSIVSFTPPGWIDIQKASTNESISKNNKNYLLEGAQYGIYSSSNDAKNNSNRLATLTCNNAGYAKSEALMPGAYYVREIKAGTGFALDTTTYTVQVKSNNTARVNANKVNEVPQTKKTVFLLGKYDTERTYIENANKAQGAATLKNAQFKVRYYDGYYNSAADAGKSGNPITSWVVKSDETGTVNLDSAHIVSGSPYKASDGNTCLPLGTYLIQEIAAPNGYLPSKEVYLSYVKATGTSETDTSYTPSRIGNQVIRGGISLEKIDSQTGKTPQGNSRFSNITFEIVNENAQSVIVGGKEYGTGEVVARIKTDDTGHAATASNTLPFGTYTVREAQSNESMLKTAPEQKVTVSQEGRVYALTFSDDVVRGGVTITKVDKESQLTTPLGAGILDGTAFQITNRSDKAVMVDGVLYQPGEIVATIHSKDGVAATSNTALPFGTYTLQEVSVEAGYLLSDNAVYEFKITKHEEMVSANKSGTIANQIKRGDLEFVKARETDSKRLAGVPFKITSRTTGEVHVMVTDENGYASTAASWAKHSVNTNENDELLSDNTADDFAVNAEAGVWFGQTSEGWITTPNDNLGALPFDTYTLEELPCEANKGLALITITDVVVKRDGVTVDLGTMDNLSIEEAALHTTARDANDGDKQILANAAAQVNDHVEYSGLVTGETYLMRAWIVDEEGKAIEGSVTEQEFTPKGQAGSLDMTIEANLIPYQGKKVIVFEECLKDGQVVAEHKDLTDSEQTVYVADFSLGTLATNSLNEEKVLVADGQSSITDSATVSGLPANHKYVLEGTVMLKTVSDTGAVNVEPLTIEGKQVTNSINFSTDKAGNATPQNTFTFDATGLDTGVELVVYEKIYYFDDQAERVDLIAEENPENEAQTITIERMEIGTRAHDKADDDQELLISEEASWYDTISYRNAIPEKNYTVVASLVWADSGQDVLVNKKIISATTSFAPATASGEVQVHFDNMDITQLKAGTVTLVERIYCEDVLVAEEVTPNNTDQQLTLVKEKPPLPQEKNYEPEQPGSTPNKLAKTGDAILAALPWIATVGAVGGLTGTFIWRRTRRSRYFTRR